MTSPEVREVRWSTRALRDLSEIRAYIAEDKPDAADRQITLLVQSAEGLVTFPGKGRPGRVDGTRELPVSRTSHIVVYEILELTVFILAILHGAQRWPQSFSEL